MIEAHTNNQPKKERDKREHACSFAPVGSAWASVRTRKRQGEQKERKKKTTKNEFRFGKIIRKTASEVKCVGRNIPTIEQV